MTYTLKINSYSYFYSQIGNSDTLEKIALKFNSTPSELLHLNKLNTRIVFPGQVYFIISVRS